jgi:hypothetical protein
VIQVAQVRFKFKLPKVLTLKFQDKEGSEFMPSYVPRKVQG